MSDTAKHAYSTPSYDMEQEEDAQLLSAIMGTEYTCTEYYGKHAA